MSDDKNKVGGQDRARVAVDQDYEVQHFASKHGLSIDEAREIIERAGGDREEADRIASAGRAGGA